MTPNQLFKLLPSLGLSELKITLAVIRETVGRSKHGNAKARVSRRRMSLDRFQKMTGLSRRGAQAGIKAAMACGLIWRWRDDYGHGFWYGIANPDALSQVVENTLSAKVPQGSKISALVGAEGEHNKHPHDRKNPFLFSKEPLSSSLRSRDGLERKSETGTSEPDSLPLNDRSFSQEDDLPQHSENRSHLRSRRTGKAGMDPIARAAASVCGFERITAKRRGQLGLLSVRLRNHSDLAASEIGALVLEFGCTYWADKEGWRDRPPRPDDISTEWLRFLNAEHPELIGHAEGVTTQAAGFVM